MDLKILAFLQRDKQVNNMKYITNIFDNVFVSQWNLQNAANISSIKY